MKYKKLFLLLLFITLASCTKKPPLVANLNTVENLEDGFAIDEPYNVGLDTDPLLTGVNDIREGKYGEVHSMLIYKDGKLVVEEYFPGHKYQWGEPNSYGIYLNWDYYHTHNIMSAGKSYTSAAIAIAIDRGYIESVHEPIFNYLPDYQHHKADGKENITIEHLVTMTSGLKWDEWSSPYTTDKNSIIDLWVNCSDQIDCILGHQLVHEPGTHFNYSGGDMIVLGEIINNATGQDIDAFLAQHLFAPMGTPPAQFNQFDSGIINSSGELHLTPRDMLKFGLLYLKNGNWEGQQIIPADWVEKCKVPYSASNSSWFNNPIIPIPGDDGTIGRRGYGYTWWTHRLSGSGQHVEMFYASGYGGQQIFVIPELDAVLVFTGGNYARILPNMKIIKRYFLPAILD